MKEPIKRGRVWRRIGWGLLVLVGAHLVLHPLYALYVSRSLEAWIDAAELDADGVLAGCGAYNLPAVGDPVTDSAVLLVHGFNASPRHWDLVAPALAERGIACRVMRLPGFAEPHALTQGADAQEWTGAVAAELAELRAAHERVGVVGHSLGGAATINVLLDDPDAADYAVLVAPAVAVSDARAPGLSTRTWHEVSQRMPLFTKLLKSPFPMDCHVEGRTDWPGRIPFSSTRVVDELFGLLDENRPRAEAFATPVTVLVSTDDLVVNTSATEAYFERIGSADKELVRLEKSGHALPLDLEWERVVEAVQQRAGPLANGEGSPG